MLKAFIGIGTQRNGWLELYRRKKNLHLDTFGNIKDAIAVRKEAEEKYHIPMLEKYRDRLSAKQLAKLDGGK